MPIDYLTFFETVEQAMEPEDIKQFRKLKNKYFRYFKQGIRDACQPLFTHKDDSGIDFIRLSDD